MGNPHFTPSAQLTTNSLVDFWPIAVPRVSTHSPFQSWHGQEGNPPKKLLSRPGDSECRTSDGGAQQLSPTTHIIEEWVRVLVYSHNYDITFSDAATMKYLPQTRPQLRLLFLFSIGSVDIMAHPWRRYECLVVGDPLTTQKEGLWGWRPTGWLPFRSKPFRFWTPTCLRTITELDPLDHR